MDLRDEIEDEGLKGWCPTRLEMACIASLPQQRNHGERERVSAQRRGRGWSELKVLTCARCLVGFGSVKMTAGWNPTGLGPILDGPPDFTRAPFSI